MWAGLLGVCSWAQPCHVAGHVEGVSDTWWVCLTRGACVLHVEGVSDTWWVCLTHGGCVVCCILPLHSGLLWSCQHINKRVCCKQFGEKWHFYIHLYTIDLVRMLPWLTVVSRDTRTSEPFRIFLCICSILVLY